MQRRRSVAPHAHIRRPEAIQIGFVYPAGHDMDLPLICYSLSARIVVLMVSGTLASFSSALQREGAPYRIVPLN